MVQHCRRRVMRQGGERPKRLHQSCQRVNAVNTGAAPGVKRGAEGVTNGVTNGSRRVLETWFARRCCAVVGKGGAREGDAIGLRVLLKCPAEGNPCDRLGLSGLGFSGSRFLKTEIPMVLPVALLIAGVDGIAPAAAAAGDHTVVAVTTTICRTRAATSVKFILSKGRAVNSTTS
eukprot:1191368-Prorocentrum_minimum.AAC.1